MTLRTPDMAPAPHLANPALRNVADRVLIRELVRANALREAVRPSAVLIRQLALERITPLELELVARGISMLRVPSPTRSRVAGALQEAAFLGDDLTGFGPVLRRAQQP